MNKILCFTFLLVFFAFSGKAQHLVVEGAIQDHRNQEPLPYANVFVKTAGIGTMTNRLGAFRLIIPEEALHDSLFISFIGFKSKALALKELSQPLIISMEENTTSLKEVVITGFTAETIVKKAIERIPQNYRQKAYTSTGFYRVTSQKDNEYIHLSEAVFDIYQSKVGESDQQFRLEKMRAIKDEKASRGIDLGLRPNSLIAFDIVQHIGAFDLLDEKSLNRHSFKIEGTEQVDGKETYRISFDQKQLKKSGLKGYLLIDKESLAFVYFDFGLSEKGIKYHKFGDAALRAMMKIMGIRITMSRDNYQIQYKKLGDTYFLNNVGNDATLTFKSERDHYNFKADTRVDYLITKIETDSVFPFSKEEVLRQNRLIEEQNSSYDPDFWKNYTIVLPTSDFNEISRKLEANNKANDLKMELEGRLSKLPKNLTLRVDSILSFYNRKDLFNGNALVSHQGKVLLQKSYNNKLTHNKKESQFRIGSVSKTFTAMLVAQLERESQLKYTDSIKTYLPDYSNPNVTISQLLSHQSGIANYLTNQEYLTNILTNTYTTDQLVTLFCSDPLEFDPGSKFEYSNSNYVILSVIIEKITTKDFPSVLQATIFDPLQMEHSYFGAPLDSMNLATGYMYGKPEPAYAKQNVIGAGGISSTTDDLLKWSRALDGEQLLSKEGISQLLKPRAEYSDMDAYYGYGWLIDGYMFSVSKKHSIYYHPGTDFGFYSMFVKQPDTGITIILLSNTGEFSRFEMTELLLNELN